MPLCSSYMHIFFVTEINQCFHRWGKRRFSWFDTFLCLIWPKKKGNRNELEGKNIWLLIHTWDFQVNEFWQYWNYLPQGLSPLTQSFCQPPHEVLPTFPWSHPAPQQACCNNLKPSRCPLLPSKTFQIRFCKPLTGPFRMWHNPALPPLCHIIPDRVLAVFQPTKIEYSLSKFHGKK